MQIHIPVVTVDGPSGTGKGTVSALVAETLGWNLLDSGVIYRALGLAASRHQVAFDNEAALTVLAAHLDVQFIAMKNGRGSRVILEGDDVTDEIRTEICGDNASKIGSIASVREALLARQRAFQTAPGLITDGRDMGTVVFPLADLKIYLDASEQARAERRYHQLKKKGLNVTLAAVYQDLEERDQRDKKRAVAPLKPAKDAILIDTTHLSIEQAKEKILQLIQTTLAERMHVTE